MDLDELLARAANTPNADIDCFVAGDDLSAAAGLVVSVDADKTVRLCSSLGMGIPTARPAPLMGYAQNAPAPGYPVVLRVTGMTRCTFGGAVEVGDVLTFDETNQKVISWFASGLGHAHVSVIPAVRYVVEVANDVGIPIPGIDPALFETTLQWDNSGSLDAASETVTVEEISGGEYRVSFEPENLGYVYRLRVRCKSDSVNYDVVTPGEFQAQSMARYGQPSELSISQIIGVAMSSGADGDPGLMVLGKQIF